MVKEVEELMDGARKTEKWAGAAHDYLKKSLDNLNTLTGDLDNKSPLRKANKNFREVRRSLAKMQGPFNDVKKNIPKLKDILPETEKKKLVAAETQLAPNEAELIEEGSYLRGGMKDDFGDFNVQFALLSNLHRKEDRKEEQQRAVVTRMLSELIRKVKELIAEPEGVIPKSVGLVPFIAVMGKIYDLAESWEKMSQ